MAAAAGVTQPYVFHFFKSKEELFNAVINRAIKKIYETFIQIDAPADRLMETMGNAFIQIMHAHRDEILMSYEFPCDHRASHTKPCPGTVPNDS